MNPAANNQEREAAEPTAERANSLTECDDDAEHDKTPGSPDLSDYHATAHRNDHVRQRVARVQQAVLGLGDSEFLLDSFFELRRVVVAIVAAENGEDHQEESIPPRVDVLELLSEDFVVLHSRIVHDFELLEGRRA